MIALSAHLDARPTRDRGQAGGAAGAIPALDGSVKAKKSRERDNTPARLPN